MTHPPLLKAFDSKMGSGMQEKHLQRLEEQNPGSGSRESFAVEGP